MNTSRCLILATTVATVLSGAAVSASEPSDAGRARAEKLLEAMGGREAWAKVKFVHVEAVHDDVDIAQSFTNKIWNDFTAPRLRFEARNAELDSRRVIDGEKGERVGASGRSALTAEQIEDDRKWWEANVYRTLHRLAVNDPDLTARAVGKHRVEIFRKDGKRLNWFHLNQRGDPMLFGTWDSEAGTAFGPLASSGQIKYPKWGARPDGSWRYEIVRLVASDKVPTDVSFTEP